MNKNYTDNYLNINKNFIIIIIITDIMVFVNV